MNTLSIFTRFITAAIFVSAMACVTSAESLAKPTPNAIATGSGAGLDYRSWNGAILRGPNGGMFGVRVGVVRDGKLITGTAFYDEVARAGDYDPSGSYASVATKSLKLEWRFEGNQLYGMVTAATRCPVVIECYPAQDYSGEVIPAGAYIPFRNPARFSMLDKSRAEGSSPILKITPGTTFITGGHARVEGRDIEQDSGSDARDYFGIGMASEADSAYSGDLGKKPDPFNVPPDGIAKTGPADMNEGGFWVDQNSITYFHYIAEPGKPIAFKAATDTKPVFPCVGFIDRDIPKFIREGKSRFDAAKIQGAGPLAGWTRLMLNEISWMRMLLPFGNKIVIPAGRPWMLDGRYNCWGWDENFNSMIVSVEDPKVAEDTLSWALGCERLGPHASWSVYCRTGSRSVLEKVYPTYHGIYPPGNPDLVHGQPDWTSGPCDNPYVGKGMDDTPMRERSRNLGPMWSLDMSCMKAWSIEVLSRMAAELGHPDESAQYSNDLAAIRSKINDTFWMESEGIYRNRYVSGAWSITESPTSFYPWLAGCPDEKQSQAMLRALKDPKRFWGSYILPTLSRQDPEYGKPSREPHNGQTFPPFSYWRGSIWPPTNFLVYEGMKRYRLDDAASELAVKSATLWGKTWDAKGWACENYDPETGERTSMAHAHQSWAMLLPLIGLKELIDVEWWNINPSLRLGSLAPGVHEIKLLPIRGHLYDLRQDDSNLVLEIDQKPAIKVAGERVVIRQFIRTETSVEFEMTTTRTTTISLAGSKSGMKTISVPAGQHKIRKKLE